MTEQGNAAVAYLLCPGDAAPVAELHRLLWVNPRRIIPVGDGSEETARHLGQALGIVPEAVVALGDDSPAQARSAWEECLARDEGAFLAVLPESDFPRWCCFFLALPLEKSSIFAVVPGPLTALVRPDSSAGWEMAYFNNTP